MLAKFEKFRIFPKIADYDTIEGILRIKRIQLISLLIMYLAFAIGGITILGLHTVFNFLFLK
jgi:hypothetical protein